MGFVICVQSAAALRHTWDSMGGRELDGCYEIAESIQHLFLSLPEVVGVFLKRNLLRKEYDDLSDIDIVVDVRFGPRQCCLRQAGRQHNGGVL